jgi:hypothetical protein
MASGGDYLTLSLTEIAALIDHPVQRSAITNPRYWQHLGNSIPRTLVAQGWRATMHPHGDAVTFSRSGHEQRTRPTRLDPLLAFLAAQEGETVLYRFLMKRSRSFLGSVGSLACDLGTVQQESV